MAAPVESTYRRNLDKCKRSSIVRYVEIVEDIVQLDPGLLFASYDSVEAGPSGERPDGRSVVNFPNDLLKGNSSEMLGALRASGFNPEQAEQFLPEAPLGLSAASYERGVVSLSAGPAFSRECTPINADETEG